MTTFLIVAALSGLVICASLMVLNMQHGNDLLALLNAACVVVNSWTLAVNIRTLLRETIL